MNYEVLMRKESSILFLLAYAAFQIPSGACADTGTGASRHAPAGVMVDHRHKRGSFMVSYRRMYMEMEGNRDGTASLTPERIATTVPNRFYGTGMQPPTLRTVPLSMTMNMNMVGIMYGLTDTVTLVASGSYTAREMENTVFSGSAGTDRLGNFDVQVNDFGDIRIGTVIGLDRGVRENMEMNFGFLVSLPTGSLTEEGEVLTPMDTQMKMRYPYAMQSGSGTYDLLPSLTARVHYGKMSLGIQMSGTVRTGSNEEGYTRENDYGTILWVARQPVPWMSVSGRISGTFKGHIKGIDENIVAPVQTADPLYYGGNVLKGYLGINLAGQSGAVKGHGLALEAGMPLVQDLNGPQLESGLSLTMRWYKSFGE